jgi:hypothetical protein
LVKLETIEIQPRSKIDTTTKQDVNEMQEIDQIQKVKKVRHFFRQLDWIEHAFRINLHEICIIENGTVDQKI